MFKSICYEAKQTAHYHRTHSHWIKFVIYWGCRLSLDHCNQISVVTCPHIFLKIGASVFSQALETAFHTRGMKSYDRKTLLIQFHYSTKSSNGDIVVVEMRTLMTHARLRDSFHTAVEISMIIQVDVPEPWGLSFFTITGASIFCNRGYVT